MEDSEDSNLGMVLSLGTLAVIVLLVIMVSGLVTFLSLYLWFRTVAAQELHCGHCHSLMGLQGVMQPPQAAPLQLPHRNYLATAESPTDQFFIGRSDQSVEYQSATNQRLGMKGSASNSDHDNMSTTLPERPVIRTCSNGMTEYEVGQSVMVGVRFTASPSRMMTPYSKQSESIIVNSKHPFHRTCSTRKKVLPRFRKAGNGRESSQSQQNWLDISQMCRTVLSRISPRQRFSKSGVMTSQTRPVMQVKEEAIDHPVPPHNYIHPLNDVERYNAFIQTNIQSQLPPSSPYGYLTKGGDPQLHTAGYRQSWGSTLPEYTEFLI